MFTTNHLYVSPNVLTVQYCVDLPLGSTRERTLRGMLLTKVWTLSRGTCCRKFGLQPLVMTNSFVSDQVQLVRITSVRSWNSSTLFFNPRRKSGKFAGTLSEMK